MRYGIGYLRSELRNERIAAECQVRRLESLAARLTTLELETEAGSAMACQALIRLAQLLKAARAYATRLLRDERALT